MKNKKKGFTLLELIIVLVIVSVLAAIIIPPIIKMVDKCDSTSTRAIITLNENESITVEVDRWVRTGNYLKLVTTDGTEYNISADNVIIIKEKNSNKG